MQLLWLSSGAFLGWSLGANDASNIFGTAVATRAVKFITAASLMSIFLIAGALIEGSSGLETIRNLSTQNLRGAFIITFAAACTTTLMTVVRMPVSTSQAVVGAILGSGFAAGSPSFRGLGKVVLCWIGTPIGALLLAVIAYTVLGAIFNRFGSNILRINALVKAGLIFAGCYGSYALGANNVANATGVFVGLELSGVTITPVIAALIGSVGMGIGVFTYSRRVMMTVGKGLVPLESFSALVGIVAQAATVHLYAMVGVPVSASQAIVGAVMGIGLVKGIKSIDTRMLMRIVTAWLCTPVIAAIFAFGLYYFMLPFKAQ
ncbi:MAG: inorganic phosphate transporter [Chitinivibrionales bacterium]|nr:inorganic phosphate transporter [Chitinivibrionales bacterium]